MGKLWTCGACVYVCSQFYSLTEFQLLRNLLTSVEQNVLLHLAYDHVSSS